MVQHIYAQEIQLMEQQEVVATSSLKIFYAFIDREGLHSGGGRLQQSILPYQAMRQMI
jgi:hypothetical protein